MRILGYFSKSKGIREQKSGGTLVYLKMFYPLASHLTEKVSYAATVAG
jgi:hypothetical protein